MSKNLKNKVDSIRRTLKNNSLEVLGTVIESKILELYPNHETQWNNDGRAEVIKSITNDHKITETINAIASPTSKTITHYQEVETLTQEEIQEEELDILTPVEESIESPEYEEDEVSAIALAEKADLVTATAQDMGIELKLSEVESIASDLDYSGDSLEEGISNIESAITAFVEYKAQVNQQKINHMIDEVRATVSQRNQETSQHLNNGLNQIAQDIKQANTDFKSSVRSALKCFAIPTDQTGERISNFI